MARNERKTWIQAAIAKILLYKFVTWNYPGLFLTIRALVALPVTTAGKEFKGVFKSTVPATDDFPARTIFITPSRAPGARGLRSLVTPNEGFKSIANTGNQAQPVQLPVVTTYSDFSGIDNSVIVVPPLDSGYQPIYIMFASPRDLPGTVTGQGQKVENNVLLAVHATPPPVAVQNTTPGAAGNRVEDDEMGSSREGSREACSVRDGTRDGIRGSEITESSSDGSDESKPNLGKDIAKATNAEKAELGGLGMHSPGGWGPEDEDNARKNDSQKKFENQDQIKNSSKGSENLVWDSWHNNPKTTIAGRQYAKIGDKFYAQHAVDRMQPSGLGSPAGTVGPGRNVTPNMVDHVIKTGTPQSNVVGGIVRTTYWSGDVGVVTENNGNVIITVLRRSGK